MSLSDYLTQTKRGFREKPAREACRDAGRELFVGAARRAGRRLDDVGLLPRTPIWSRQWDVCCILDGCRVDVFEDVARSTEWIDERSVSSIWSLGSASPEWIDRTFAPEYSEVMQSTAYITANPFSCKPEDRAAGARSGTLPLSESDFAHFDEAWRSEWRDEPISTVEPRPLTDRAIDVWRRRESLSVERIIVHYMQPHIPFRSRPEWFGRRENLDIFGEGGREGGKSPWLKVRDGEIDRDEFVEAYRDNLVWVLDDVDLMRQNLDGRIALSSDHGNGLGEFGVWSHPPESPFPNVRKVPYTTVEGRDLGGYTPEVEGPTGSSVAEDVVDERLAALGYREASE